MLKLRNKHETRFICLAEGDEPPAGGGGGGNTLGNAADARNPDGSLKDPAAAPPEKKADETPPPDKKAEAWAEYVPDPKKTAEENAAAKTEHDKTKPAEGAPDKYEFKAPDGMKLDEKLIEKITPIFKQHNLPQAAAQALVDAHNDVIKSVTDGLAEQHKTTREGWGKEIAMDPALGNGKDNFKPEVMTTIASAIDSLGTKDAAAFRTAMDMTGVGDHPAFARGFYALAKQLVEGHHVGGKNPSKHGQDGGPKDTPAGRLYPNLPSSS